MNNADNAGLPCAQTSHCLAASSGRTGKMRKLLNVLAVIIGLVSGLAALFCTGAAVFIAGSFLGGKRPTLLDPTGIVVVGLVAGLAFLGFLIAHRAWLHLRQPDAGTARDMIGTAIYLIVMAGIFPLFKNTALQFPLIFGLYVLHRVLANRVTAQLFPHDVTTSQT